jgi:hypothetical protein
LLPGLRQLFYTFLQQQVSTSFCAFVQKSFPLSRFSQQHFSTVSFVSVQTIVPVVCSGAANKVIPVKSTAIAVKNSLRVIFKNS